MNNWERKMEQWKKELKARIYEFFKLILLIDYQSKLITQLVLMKRKRE
jgi:hypothetical protein